MGTNLIATGLLALALIGASPRPQQAAQRMDVKGIRLGATLAEMQAIAKLTCGADRVRAFDTVCRYADPKDGTFAGRRASSVIFGLSGGRLDTVQVELPAGTYERVRMALDGKFGAASSGTGLHSPCSYTMNGDRVRLVLLQGSRTLLLFEAAAATRAAASERRADATLVTARKDV
jgi:hypothetical protein